ncbi:MAG: metallophosphoesterase family protein [Nitrospiraceae bacterium]
MATIQETLRIAAVADTHCPRVAGEELRALFAHLAEHADVVLLCGDLTDYGKPDEARQFVQGLSTVQRVPVLAVLGNHDYECGQEDEVVRILSDGGVTVLDGTSVEIKGIGFIGVKGFAGGFGDRALQPWGERVLKQFVQETVEESVKLESALAKMQTAQRVVLMHYSPILASVQGEAPEIIPFLGSSRLEEPLNRYGVTAVFHGHAHHGAPEGRTREGIPVYNVAMPLLRRHFPDRLPVRFIEMPIMTEQLMS